jgi:hypothetical protein
MEESYLQIVLSRLQYLTPPPKREQRTAWPLPRLTLLGKYQHGALMFLITRQANSQKDGSRL